MPKGGHFGLWKPVPKDIYKSRWKMFYKRCPRKRAPDNNPDAPGPHGQPDSNFDGVPAPWKLDYSFANFEKESQPPDARALGKYGSNLKTYMEPWKKCKDVRGRAAIIQALDPGNRGSDSGLGRFQCFGTMYMQAIPHSSSRVVVNPFPSHIQMLVKDELEKASGFKLTSGDNKKLGAKSAKSEINDEDDDDDEAEAVAKTLKKEDDEYGAERLRSFFGSEERNSPFMVRRLASLLHEHEIVWKHGQGTNRLGRKSSESSRADDGKDRGHFPFADEQASLIDDLGLAEILRLSHRTASRRHPKWKEIQYEFRRKKQSFLRRRQMALDEAKASMGVIKQSKTE